MEGVSPRSLRHLPLDDMRRALLLSEGEDAVSLASFSKLGCNYGIIVSESLLAKIGFGTAENEPSKML